MTTAAVDSVAQCYSDEQVRSRMIAFMGGTTVEKATCIYLSHCDGVWGGGPSSISPSALDEFLQAGDDVGRSLWDRQSLIVHLDIEYVNFDFPAEPYLDQHRTFALQQPLMKALVGLCEEFGLRPLHLLSGRGHHLVWRVGKNTSVFAALGALGRAPPHLLHYYESHPGPGGVRVGIALARAFAGLSLVLEYLAHLALDRVGAETVLPVTLTAVASLPGERGRESVVFDISEYGDPLNTRVIRLPFSVYLKPWRRSGIMHRGIADRVPLIFTVPLLDSVDATVDMMTRPELCARQAAQSNTAIPEQDKSMQRLVEAYEGSEVRRFHDSFYGTEQDKPSRWRMTYDRTDMNSLPPCVADILCRPNDRLLRPEGLQLIARTFLALGWHPRHIAGLVRSKFERNYEWGRRWYVYDASTRAEFYIRLFSGLVLCGRDTLEDFSSEAARARRLCLMSDCRRCTIEHLRDKLRKELS